MKMMVSSSLLSLLFFTSAGLAQVPPPNTTEDASAAAKSAPQPGQPGKPSPGTISPSAAAQPTARNTQTCHQQASEQKLAGAAETSFLKDCNAGKNKPVGN